MRKKVANFIFCLVVVVSIAIGYKFVKEFNKSIELSSQTSFVIADELAKNNNGNISKYMSDIDIGEAFNVLGSSASAIDEYEVVEITQFYENMSFSTTNGDLVKLIGVSISPYDEQSNLDKVRNLVEGKTLYLVKDPQIEDNEEDYLYRYVYSSEPTDKDDIESSLNAYLIRRGFCDYNKMFNTNYEKKLSKLEKY